MRATMVMAALAAMMASPVLAAGTAMPIKATYTKPSPAAALSLGARRGAPVGRSNSLAGGNGLGIAMLAVVLGGAAWAAYEMINGDDNDQPASP